MEVKEWWEVLAEAPLEEQVKTLSRMLAEFWDEYRAATLPEVKEELAQGIDLINSMLVPAQKALREQRGEPEPENITVKVKEARIFQKGETFKERKLGGIPLDINYGDEEERDITFEIDLGG